MKHTAIKKPFLPCFLPIFPSLPMFARCHCAKCHGHRCRWPKPDAKTACRWRMPGPWLPAALADGDRFWGSDGSCQARLGYVRVGGWMEKRGILKGFKGIDPPFFFTIFFCWILWYVIIWFVVWNMNFMTFHSVGNVIIPTVTHSIIFQRGGEKPPTTCSW